MGESKPNLCRDANDSYTVDDLMITLWTRGYVLDDERDSVVQQTQRRARIALIPRGKSSNLIMTKIVEKTVKKTLGKGISEDPPWYCVYCSQNLQLVSLMAMDQFIRLSLRRSSRR